jgi:hypothetical protein
MNVSLDSFPFGFLPGAGLVWVLAVWILTAIVHVSLAFAVLADTQLLWKHFRRHTFLVGGGLWALATLLGGVFVAAIYWLIHHSTLRPQQPPPALPEKPEAAGNP